MAYSKKCGKSKFEWQAYLHCIKLAAVATIGSVVRAVEYWLLLATMWSLVRVRVRRNRLDQAGALDH